MPSLFPGMAGFTIVVIALTVLIHFGWFSIGLALKVGAILIGVAWLYALIRIPWDLYFAARHGRQDGELSQARGIAIEADVVHSLKQYEGRLLTLALLSHGVSAALMGLFGHLAPEQFHPGFVWLFALSAGVRPAGEMYTHLARRIRELAQRTRYPREDILSLIAKVDALEARAAATTQEVAAIRRETGDQIKRQDHRIAQVESREATNHVAVEKRVATLSHELESTVSKLTADRELIAGVKAFARMFREQGA